MPSETDYPRAIVDNGLESTDPLLADFEGRAQGNDESADTPTSADSIEYLEIIATNLEKDLGEVNWPRADEPTYRNDEPHNRINELVGYMRTRSVAPEDVEVTYETVVLGFTIMGRFRMRADMWRKTKHAEDPYRLLKNRVGKGMGQELEASSRWLPPDSGSRRQPPIDHGFPFTPGSISFRGDNRPIAMTAPSDVVDIVYQTRWKLGANTEDPPRRATVGLLDTGVVEETAMTHPLLGGALLQDQIDGTRDAELPVVRGIVDDVYGHGVHTAGIVLQRCPEALVDIETVRSGLGRTSDSFELARDLPDIERCDIVVFSLAVAANNQNDLPALRAVVRHLLERGKVVVAAAGLRRENAPESERVYFPADFQFGSDDVSALGGRLIRVGAVDARDERVQGNRVPTTERLNQVLSQANSYGVGIASAYPKGLFRVGARGQPLVYTDGWARWTGTSFAAPRVAGAIADRFMHPKQTDAFTSVVDAADAVINEAEASGIVS